MKDVSRSSGRRWLSITVAIVALLVASIGQVASADEYYTIEPGDNLSSIAYKYGVGVDDLAVMNDIANPSLIISGDVLVVPTNGSPNTSGNFIHVVEWGDNLPYLAEHYGVDLYELASVNDLDYPWTIYPEQELVIPGYASSPAPTPALGGGFPVYVVEWGDNLPYIASLFGVDLYELASVNGLEYPWLIFPDQELVIPDAWPIASDDADQWGDVHPIDMPSPGLDEVRDMLYDAAVMYDWDPYLIMSLAWTESRWRQDTVSWADAYGVMQLLLDTAEWTSWAVVGREVDPIYNTWDNIETGVAYLTNLRSLTGDDYLALAAYFQGLGSVERDGVFSGTHDYAVNIIQMRDLFATGTLP